MSEVAFKRVSVDLREGVQHVFTLGRLTPTLLLIYTSIDVFASMTRPVDQIDTHGGIFKDWVNKFMLPDSGLPCTAADIWSARCGLLHTLTAESRNSRAGKARMINYVGDTSSPEEMQR